MLVATPVQLPAVPMPVASRFRAATSTRGFAFQKGIYQHQVWLTRDGGRHWSAVTVR